MSASDIQPTVADIAETPAGGNTPQSSPQHKGRKRNLGLALVFLAPALILLGALLVYPVVYTVIRSFFDASGSEFVGLDKYFTMFSNDSTFTAIRNNIIWVIVAPVMCTVLGLIFAVMMEKIRWSTAFKLIVFMPMAISMLAAGVIFRGMFQEDPQVGVVNAAVVGVSDWFGGEGPSYPGAKPRDDAGIAAEQGSIASEDTVETGSTQDFPLVAIRADDLPENT